MSAAAQPGSALLDVYDEALPQVYGYLLPRCSDPVLAQDLTAATFLAAVGKHPEPLTVAWLIGVARHKLVDHWRRREREERALRRVSASGPEYADPWDEALDAVLAHQVLATLGPHHRAALTLRYLDGLPVREVATHLQRTVHGTEALLVRARAAFRAAYPAPGACDD